LKEEDIGSIGVGEDGEMTLGLLVITAYVPDTCLKQHHLFAAPPLTLQSFAFLYSPHRT
jgi:hypothetical protein